MTKKIFFVGMAALALLFGLVITGCESTGGGDWTPEYTIGDTGPGGGKIFYVSEAGFAVEGLGTCHYLEAAPEDINEKIRWASPAFMPPYGQGDDNPNFYFGGTGNWTDIPGSETGIGAGKQNTRLILATDANAPAALACKQYSSNGKIDWFLPSKDELNELYRNRNSMGGLDDEYWSSSPSYPEWAEEFSTVWMQQFSDGRQRDGFIKYAPKQVRAVRAF